jgi:hypothetical protein
LGVNIVDPDAASPPDGGGGEFPVVLRGYDRQLVDAHVGELAGHLEQERRHRQDAERRLGRLQRRRRWRPGAAGGLVHQPGRQSGQGV